MQNNVFIHIIIIYIATLVQHYAFFFIRNHKISIKYSSFCWGSNWPGRMSVPVGEMCENDKSYSNRICFLSNEELDYMVTAKHAAEEAIGLKLLP